MHYLLVKKIQRVAHGPPLAAGARIAGSAGSVVTPLVLNRPGVELLH